MRSSTVGRFFEALAGGRLDVPQQLVAKADHSTPLAAGSDRERHQLMPVAKFSAAADDETLGNLVNQEPAVVVDRWEDEDAFLVRLLEERPYVLVYRPDELVIGHAQVPVHD